MHAHHTVDRNDRDDESLADLGRRLIARVRATRPPEPEPAPKRVPLTGVWASTLFDLDDDERWR